VSPRSPLPARILIPVANPGTAEELIRLGAAMLEHGVTPEALAAYDAKLCGPISQLILRNRGRSET